MNQSMRIMVIGAACEVIAALRNKPDVIVISGNHLDAGDFICANPKRKISSPHYSDIYRAGKGQRKANKANRWK